MSRLETKAPFSVHWTEWLRRQLISKEIESPEVATLTTHIEEAFDETYEFDGLSITQRPLRATTNLSDNESDDECNNPEDEESLSQIFAYLSPIFGLPSRDLLKSGDSWKAFFKQLGKNLIGGWDSGPDISFKKKVWQWIVSPIKVLIILPLKILGFPLKLLLNFIKIFTEFLPLIISSISAQGMGWALKTLRHLSADPTKHTEAATIELPLLPEEADSTTPLTAEKSATSFIPLKIVGLFLLYLLLGTVHIAFRIITLAGRALTSPEKSARIAFASGRELNITLFGDSKIGLGFGRFLSTVVGGLGAVISIGITAMLWLITFPLLLSALASAFPVILQAITWVAQLTPVLGTMTWISQTPLLTTSLGAAQGALINAFGPAISALAAFIGLKLSVGILAAGTMLGLIAAPLTVIVSRVADEISNAWARPWPGALPLRKLSQSLFKPIPTLQTTPTPEPIAPIAVQTVDQAPTVQTTPASSGKAKLLNLIQQEKSADKSARQASAAVSSTSAKITAPAPAPSPKPQSVKRLIGAWQSHSEPAILKK